MAEKQDRKVVRVTPATFDALKAIAEEQEEQMVDTVERVLAAGLAALAAGVRATSLPSADSVLPPYAKEKLEEFAKEMNLPVPDAALRLITVGINRLKALAEYNAAKKAKEARMRGEVK